MIKKLIVIFVTVMVISVFSLTAGNGPGNGSGDCKFIDENGDGINDNFRDHDGDGVPNYLDPDWVKPQDGTGYGTGNGKMNRNRNQRNINGTCSFNSFGNMNNFGGNYGSGVCDGTGAGKNNGKRRRGGRG